MRHPTQLSLDGIGAAPLPTDRLFFAILPDADATAHAGLLAQQITAAHGLSGTPLATERLHVTLHHLGDYAGLPQDIVAAAGPALSALRFPPFEVVLDRAMTFGKVGRRPVVLGGHGSGVAGLVAFQQALLAAIGGRASGNFVPHLSLLYDEQAVPEHDVAPITWIAREFVLVHSAINQRKREHETLARWPLRR
ncbi:2'-5' RNA ligase family protein [Variovorax fucosicus]|uniref:2'-5' RNA ligase family protein n=1 Tax=Variovorax fucosicus TaxID=3053517 RepID=UPI0025776EDC|nr:2'-5' RNA ligase family protein [Variovorax sp. J22G47]MDM0057471.1 2'-5' RNA ligase family protein [Variovorax sp. J22G47]